MGRARQIIPWLVLVATFGWLLDPNFRHGPAVLWPSVVAVGLAFVTRDIYLSLFLGAFCGAILLRDGDVARAFLDLFSEYLIPALQDPWNISVLVFTLMMGGFVEVLNRNGSMQALAEWVLGRAHSRRRVGLAAYGLGWLIFFDGLASSVLVGKTMRPLADRVGLSRAKLAFIVDSTSAPIAGLALISTWVAYEMSVIRQGLENVGDPGLLASAAPYQLLVQSLPYRFYNYFVLLLVFLTIWMGRDIGPMRQAERAARQSLNLDGATAQPGVRGGRSWLAVLLVGVLVAAVFAGLFVDGGGLTRPFSFSSVMEAFGAANAALVFVWATALATMVAMGLSALFPGAEPDGGPVRGFFEGMQQMFLPTLILVFAWVLNAVIKRMGTAPYLVTFLGQNLSPVWLPVLVFVLGALVSFSTGTSWGTMALLMPLVVPVAVRLTGLAEGSAAGPVFLATIGAVLAGAVFGDHCSPISDTTIVSAFSSDCDAMEHVRTQMPYALMGAAIAAVIGYTPAARGWSPYGLLLLGGAFCWALIRFGGRSSADP